LTSAGHRRRLSQLSPSCPSGPDPRLSLFLEEELMSMKRIAAVALPLSLMLAAASAHAKDNGIQGTWLPEAAELGGKPFPDEIRKSITLVVKDDTYTVTVGPAVDKGTLTFDPSAKPKHMDVVGTEGPNKGKTYPAIYERNGDTLRICYDLSGKGYPADFKTMEGTQLYLVTYKQQKQ
jgi:uncharacterized protein (TIGR03067 family)